MARKRSRLALTIGAALLIGGGLTAAFWPQPVMVDIGVVATGPMVVAIAEEGRTRVHDAYVVSTPVTGRLLRVQVEPGDVVVRGQTVVAEMRPTNPVVLDVSTREQARAAVAAAEAALRVARADHNAATANADLAQSDLERTAQLAASGTVARAALDRAEREARAAAAALETSIAAIAMREAELANANARLIGFDDQGLAAALGNGSDAIALHAPADGRILQVMQQSETTLSVGTPIMEIGNIEADLEVVVALLSTDAVQVSIGDRVIIDNWGGLTPLPGEVLRVDPFGTTRFSALGVEEQRVNAVIGFTGPPEDRAGLGHGFRVETRIVVWESDAALIVPSSALYRSGTDWSVFTVTDGLAQPRTVQIGHNNGLLAEVLDGLAEGDQVILFPSAGITPGLSVTQRLID